MRHLPPVRFDQLTPGTVITDGAGTPRTVIANDEARPGVRLLLLEGLPPLPVYAHEHADVVELDTADAIGNLFAAGLTIGIVE